jgi:hypothetical protein
MQQYSVLVTTSSNQPGKKRCICYKRTIFILILVGASILGLVATGVYWMLTNAEASERNGNEFLTFVQYSLIFIDIDFYILFYISHTIEFYIDISCQIFYHYKILSSTCNFEFWTQCQPLNRSTLDQHKSNSNYLRNQFCIVKV